MAAAATGDTRHELYERPDLTRVKPAHVQLMRAYVSALAGASQVDRQTEPSKDLGFVLGPLVRWLVGSHIKRNLMDLGTVYLQLEQTFTCDDSDPIDSWLPKVREGCLAAAERLPRLRLTGIIGIVTAVAAFAGLLSKLPGWVGRVFLGLAVGAVSILWVPYLFIRGSYLYKRSLFLRDARRVDKEKTEDQKDVRDNNIYVLEDELFRLLHRGKKLNRNRPVDANSMYPNASWRPSAYSMEC